MPCSAVNDRTLLEQSCAPTGILVSESFKAALGPHAARFSFAAGPVVEMTEPHGGGSLPEQSWHMAWGAGDEEELRAPRLPAEHGDAASEGSGSSDGSGYSLESGSDSSDSDASLELEEAGGAACASGGNGRRSN